MHITAPLPSNPTIAILGLGYVGLPLAVAFGRIIPTIGFDINQDRIHELKNHIDKSAQVSTQDLHNATLLQLTSNEHDLSRCNVFIITVPTPVDAHKKPLLTPLEVASKIVGKYLQNGSVVIYESTVYPGCTEEFCIPILEQSSNLKLNKEFYVGYSPERVNPGDKLHRIEDIVKVTSGSSLAATDFIDSLYKMIIKAGTHKASSIRVAEASKVIENIQRDVNIALINELSILFHKLEIDTTEVINASSTKWNFMPFKPGLVGGHCIGVDPYYLTHKAQEIGHHPEIILAGRRINDGMGEYTALRAIKLLNARGIAASRAKILILGFTFKENCPDTRNTKVIDIIKTLSEFGASIVVHDPIANPKDVEHEYNIKISNDLPDESFDCVILAVAHDQYKLLNEHEVKKLTTPNGVIFDVKSIWPRPWVDERL